MKDWRSTNNIAVWQRNNIVRMINVRHKNETEMSVKEYMFLVL
jgi:hypothetical protein